MSCIEVTEERERERERERGSKQAGESRAFDVDDPK